MSELKPCPFCGSKAGLVTILGRTAISCYNCPAIMIHNYDTDEQDLVHAWNTRNKIEETYSELARVLDNVEKALLKKEKDND